MSWPWTALAERLEKAEARIAGLERARREEDIARVVRDAVRGALIDEPEPENPEPSVAEGLWSVFQRCRDARKAVA